MICQFPLTREHYDWSIPQGAVAALRDSVEELKRDEPNKDLLVSLFLSSEDEILKEINQLSKVGYALSDIEQ